MDYDKLAAILVRYSAAVHSGAIVNINGPPSAESLVTALYREVLRAGGHPLGLMRPETCDELLAAHGNGSQQAFVDPLAERAVDVADVVIDLLAAPALLAAADPGRLAIVQTARRELAVRFARRAAEGTLRWTAVAFPRDNDSEYDRALTRAMRLDQPDPVAAWHLLGAAQARLIQALAPARELRIVTAGGSDLRVGIAGCPWINGVGRENFPDGEVWAAPIADSAEGTVAFEFPTLLAGQRISQARLRFRAGQVVDASALEGQVVLVQLLDQMAGARQLGEVALGCNYAITQPMGHPLLDEKTGGTFHLALGSPNRTGVHLDLIGDLRPGGRVEADGRAISVDGRFVDPSWPQPGL
ncbi:hypothetical protein AYO44_08210 [Planctomycetaceae bacterium SCGC AG-212-F19]|nr:hypothetical protein AYO44_08210 [Planctomycetaceae bacterium SCGC AG-212-F19]